VTFSTLLVANRGEIACRVLRAAHDLGYGTVAVYSDADAGAPHVALADRAVRIGPGPAAQSYLDPERILDAARRTGADAIHPGYGFLSENATFAAACAFAGVTFVGPPPEAIAAMGDKAQAKDRAEAAGLPTVPGYRGAQDDAALAAAAREVGFPLLVKAAAGGGGRGMRRVDEAAALAEAVAAARAEAQAAFGDGTLLLERLVEGARHVEVQVLADAHGAAVHLGERDCSVQRRYQKVIEEAPSPAVDAALRQRIGEAAVALCRAIGYRSAGTVELLLGADGSFYFLEMNTRLQVEHPVTELVTGVDLVAWQLRIAAGEPLGFTQADVRLAGHAVEARLYAEDPARGYAPQAGRVVAWAPPAGAGVRCDHGLRSGLEVTPFYDPMLAKVIAHGRDRDEARRRLDRALGEAVALGLATNAAHLRRVLAHPVFAAGEATTSFLDGPGAGLEEGPPADAGEVALAAALLARGGRAGAPPGVADGWRPTGPAPFALELEEGGSATAVAVTVTVTGRDRYAVTVGEAAVEVAVLGPGPGEAALRVRLDGVEQTVRAARVGGELLLHAAGGARCWRERRPAWASPEEQGDGQVRAASSGQVTALGVAVGDAVAADQVAVRVESMKIEQALPCGVAGAVREVRVAPGDQVQAGQVLVVVEPSQ